MMAEVALAALGPAIEVVKFVAQPIKRQFNYLCCFTSNINSLKDEAKRLDDALAGLEGEVEQGRDNALLPVPQVETWLTDSKKIQDEITGILNEATTVESGCCSKLGARFSLSRRAKKTTESTEKLRGEKPTATFLPRPKAARLGVQLGKTFECESRNKIEQGIMTALRGGDENMIGICGMGGLGKTTMAKKIMNRALKEDVFVEVVIVTLSQNVDISKIQDEIGGQLGLTKLKEETSQSGRVQILLSRLSDTKRSTLLVLDDVWETPPLESIGIPRDSKGCTILLTSRNRDVLHDMGVQIFGMEVLSKEEAWSFFRERAGTCVDNTELKPIAKEVAKECGGLPINLAAVGAVLKDQGKAAIWKDTLRKLKQNVPSNVRYDKQNYNPLKLSYDYLKSEDRSKPAESIFLLCCLFPEDADIPLDYLTHFCMGLRIFEDDITNMEEAWYSMCAKTELLKDRSLLLESDKKDCVRMHDVVRDVCTLIAKEEGYIGKDGGRWISSSHLVGQRNELLSGSRCPNLKLLFLNRTYDSSGFQFDDAFLEGMTQLYVLCIQNYRSLTTLPHPTQSLGKLHTLILDSCYVLETISVVGELVNLEILICRRCYGIENLPSEMKGLNRLKLLELTGCSKLHSIGRGVISSLVGLEELKMLDSFNGWGERENASIKELEALTNLACLEIDIKDPSLVTKNMPLLSKKIVRFRIRNDFRNMPSEFSKAMSLSLERETRLGDWIEMQLLRDTECLCLSGDGANNVDLAKSQNIRWLRLEECESMKNIVRTSGGSDDATVFPSIEHLTLYSLPELQEICDGPISSTSFQNLKELKLESLKALMQFWKSSCVPKNNNVPHFSNLSSIFIYGCDSLRNLGQLSMAGKDCLPQLEKLGIIRCAMKQVFLWNDMEEAAESQQKYHVITKVFPKLKEVWLHKLPNLTTFYQGIQAIEFPVLMELEINECPKMKSIIRSNADIDDHGSLHLLCQPQKISFGSSVKVLKMDHNPFCGHEIPSSLFNGLEELTINKYVGSMSLFTLSMAANLVSLRKLFIQNCSEMIKVIEDEEQQQQRILVFPKLEELYLIKLPKLVSLCDWKCEVELPLLRNVEIRKCPNMKNFILGLVATPNLEAFTTDLTTYVGVGIDVAFDSLKELKISGYKLPLNDDKISVSLFNGLENLIFYRCKGMSLFSSSTVRNLVNLKLLDIESCDGIVKVIEGEEEEDDGKVVLSGGEITSIVFPKLEELSLWCLPKLVRFCEWKCDVELPSLKEVVIKYCPNMENFSMGLVAAPNLEIVEIDNQEIDINVIRMKIKPDISCRRQERWLHYTGAQFVAAPNLKFVEIDEEEIDATKDLNGALHQNYLARQKEILFGSKILEINHNPFCGHEIPSSAFNGLEELTISECVGSMSLFMLSIAANLVSLRKLCIQNCDEMISVIEDVEQQERTLVFPKLEILQLEYLPELVTFCDSKCEVELPLLREMKIEACPNLKNGSLGLVATPNVEAFTTDLTTYVGVGLDVAFNSLKRLKITKNENPFGHKIPPSLCNGLEELTISNYVGSMSLFMLSVAANLFSLRELRITNCDEMIKVIEDEQQQERILVFPKLEKLYLEYLPKLVSLCDCKSEVELPLLRELGIRRCPNFDTRLVATPNLEAFSTDLTTYVGVGVGDGVAFDSLKELQITENDENPFDHDKISVSLFNGLEQLVLSEYKSSVSLFSPSAVGNLVNLRVLVIRQCDEIVKLIEDEEENEDGKVVSGGEIRRVVFPNLEELHLWSLPKLVRFCEWKCDVELPCLTKVKIEKCPNMESFSMGFVVAPNLKSVEIDGKEIDATKDLNGALQQHYLAHQQKEEEEEEVEEACYIM